jgi:branched-chain amino acid transport system substrate-binding protein
MKSSRSAFLIALGASTAAGTVRRDAFAAAPAGEPYEFHAIVEASGATAFIGAKQQQVLHVLEDYVNRTGGIKGRPLKYVFHDDETNPQVAVQIVGDLIARRVPVILGPGLSAVSQAVFPLVEKNGPVLWCTSPIVKVVPGSYTFMSAPALQDVIPVVLRYFYQNGRRNFALMTSTDASGQNFEQNFDPALSRLEFRDAKLVAREHFNTTDISVAAQISRIKAANPDVLITFVTGPGFGTLLHGVNDAGLDVPVYGSGGNMNIQLMEQYQPFLPKMLYLNAAQGVVQDPTARPGVRKAQAIFFDAMKRAGLHVEFLQSLVWDPALVMIECLRTVGPATTAAQIHQYIERLKDWPGIQGIYDFTKGDQRGLGENGAALMRWNSARKDWDLVAKGPQYL